MLQETSSLPEVESDSRNFDQELQRMLSDDGYEDPEVKVSSREIKPFVAIGALKVAKAAREDQWIKP